MSVYKFKEIQKIPPAKQLVDIVLSRTNRKTPTVTHPGFKIERIRKFYMRKVKFCQTTYSEKFTKIIDGFPQIDDIHPFYADLCNVLYDRDHYKLALGQVNATRKIIDTMAKDYVRMMKYGDSLYKCKMLKRAALGRMCTAVKKLTGTLSYLEEVRQHLGRLPTINPATRTLILTGYPNVGKSSFMNIVTNANVDVQPYAFTTKSLFVGHLDYNYVRWQVIDTPGILDHPLEDRNTIEMTAITALAHLQSAVCFFVDVSEMCGSLLPQQVALFHSIKPLFRNRPLLVLLNKTDLRPMSDLSPEEKALIESMKEGSEEEVHFFETSCATKKGVDEARNKACDLLLAKRVSEKVKAGKADALKTRLHIAGKEAPANRPAFIPESVRRQREAAETAMDEDDKEEMLEKHRMEQLGGAGVYSVDTWKRAILDNSSWKYDIVPEIMDGQNVFDFVDPDIEKKLAELEKEESLLLQESTVKDDEAYLAEFAKTESMLDELHSRMRQKRLMQKLNRTSHQKPPRSKRQEAKDVEKKLNEKGFDGTKVARDRSVPRPSSVVAKRKREASMSADGAAGASEAGSRKASKMRGVSQARSLSMTRGLSSVQQFFEVEKDRRKKMRRMEKMGKKGESDHWIPDLKPKHLYSGKRGIGKTDRR